MALRSKREIRLRWKIGGLALLLVGAGIGASQFFDDGLGNVIVYALIPLLLLLVVFFGSLLVRLRVFGFLTPDVDSLLSPAVQSRVRSWTIFKLGILGAVALLGIGSIVAAVAGAGMQHGIQGIVYLTLVMVFGNLVVGAMLNVEIVKLGGSSCRQP